MEWQLLYHQHAFVALQGLLGQGLLGQGLLGQELLEPQQQPVVVVEEELFLLLLEQLAQELRLQNDGTSWSTPADHHLHTDTILHMLDQLNKTKKHQFIFVKIPNKKSDTL